MQVPDPALIAILVLAAGAVAATVAERLGAPTLILFLLLGMAIGEDGPGGIQFDDFALVRDAGLLLLAVILAEGGFLADARDTRKVAGRASLLATAGVVVTAAITAGVAKATLDLSWQTSLLVGAVVASTDAAAVFAALRGVPLPHRLSALLETESGINDPAAALLVIGLVEYQTDGLSFLGGVTLLAEEAAFGLASAAAVIAITLVVLRKLPPPSPGLTPVIVIAAALGSYALASVVGGSGLLAAYGVGLALGSARIPHAAVTRGFLQGTAWIAQIALFVLLGLLVTPSRLIDEGLAPLLVAIGLVLLARPASVMVSLLPFRVPVREQAFIAWAGLRGGVPIVFATIPVAAGATDALRVFDVAFYVVAVSVIVQGSSLRAAARWLGVTSGGEDGPKLAEMDVATLRGLGEVVELDARRVGIADTHIRDLHLPPGVLVAAIRRGKSTVLPRGSTVIGSEDVLVVLAEEKALDSLERWLAGHRTSSPPWPPARRVG